MIDIDSLCVFRFGFGNDPFVASNCPVTNCYVTADRTLLPSLAHFDAILFHARDMDKRVIQVTTSPVQSKSVLNIIAINKTVTGTKPGAETTEPGLCFLSHGVSTQ